jgi:3-isopropylmalate/(R)-2-methylmalate dehydratase small subunit
MQPFRVHEGIAAPLDRANIDTDQIIPKQFLKRVERTGFGQFLFYDWRIRPDGTRDEAFVLNQPRYSGASVLVAGKNFGCGSSREHAPWSLADFGFRAVIAPSFADIFAANCAKNGIVTVTLPDADIAELLKRSTELDGYTITVDLQSCEVRDGSGFRTAFTFDPFRRQCLLNGWDDISLTLRHEPDIRAYEERRRAQSA